MVELLDKAEALELIAFITCVSPKECWGPLRHMASFLQKHFKRLLSDTNREAIMKDFPKPEVDAQVAKLDQEAKEQLKRKGKDPHFGAEKSLYKIQEMLELVGPLTCLWADLLNESAKVTPEDTLLLIQQALGSASHSISLEKRKVA